MDNNLIISDILPIEKSNELLLIKKRKEVLDVSCTKKYLSLESRDDLDNEKKTLLEDVRTLKEMIEPGLPEESWMIPELEKLEQELSEKKYDEILEILEKKYRRASENNDAEEMEFIHYWIQHIKQKHIDSEIGKNILTGNCNENLISMKFNS